MNKTSTANNADTRRLLACDLDGTLIANHGNVSGCAMQALEAAHRAGWTVVISTGRSIAMVPGRLKRSHAVDAFITSNGARVVLRGGETLFLRPIPRGRALPAWSALVERGAATSVFFGGNVYFDRQAHFDIIGDRERPKLERIGMLLRFFPHSYTTRDIRRRIRKNDAAIEKIGGFFSSAGAASKALSELCGTDGLAVLTTHGNDVEITAGDASKGDALSRLCERFGVKRDNVVVCGDSGNDRSMRAYCGMFVAPRNASGDVLAVADVITDCAEKDGVAKWLLTNLN